MSSFSSKFFSLRRSNYKIIASSVALSLRIFLCIMYFELIEINAITYLQTDNSYMRTFNSKYLWWNWEFSLCPDPKLMFIKAFSEVFPLGWKCSGNQSYTKPMGRQCQVSVQVDNIPCFSLVYQARLFIIEIYLVIQYYSATRTSERHLSFSTRNKNFNIHIKGPQHNEKYRQKKEY